MNIEPFIGPGSTPSRRRFWESAFRAVVASRKIAGRNVSVDEHIGKGTVINVERKRVSAAPPGTCPDVGTLTVVFSGIIMDCGCLPPSPEGPLFEASQVTDYSAINGTFTITRDIALPFFWTGDGGSYNYDAFSDESCSTFHFSDTQIVGINVICDIGGTFTVHYALGEPTLFVATGVSLGSAKSNAIGCNQFVPNGTYPDLPFDIYGIARAGSVTVSL